MMNLLSYLQYQALFLWLILAAGWTWSGINRRRERLRRLYGRPYPRPGLSGSYGSVPTIPVAQSRPSVTSATLGSAAAPGAIPPSRGAVSMPPVSVVMPVKGCRPHSLDNWESHLVVEYDGPLEFLFVVESDDDPAVPALLELRRRHLQRSGCRTDCTDSGREARTCEIGGGGGGGRSNSTREVLQPDELAQTQAGGDGPGKGKCGNGHCSTVGTTGAKAAATKTAAEAAAGWVLGAMPSAGASKQAINGDDGAATESHCSASGGVEAKALAAATGCEAAAVADPLQRQRHFRVVVAGLAESCSQKAHNLCAGIEACDPRVAPDGSGAGGGYVLCLDDDVALHPGTVRELVEGMERRPELFMATGYPFDVPPPGSSFPAYLALCYHLPLLIAFSVRPDTSFVWGGCMLLRGAQLLPGDPAGLLAAWRHGGYSDDLILASFCTERGLGITVPPFAIFPQKLDPGMTWRAWLNYLHRQLFVLDTYTNRHNRTTNHTMMVLHSVLSWLLVLPSLAALFTAAAKLLAPLALPAFAAAIGAARQLGLTEAEPGRGASTAAAGGGEPGSWAAGALAAPAGPLPGGVWAVLTGWGAAHMALVFMTAEILGLFRLLSPLSQPVLLSGYKWGRLWVAMFLSNTVLPVLMLYTYLSPEVEWGGVVYHKRRGLVKPVRRRSSDTSSVAGTRGSGELQSAGPLAVGPSRAAPAPRGRAAAAAAAGKIKAEGPCAKAN